MKPVMIGLFVTLVTSTVSADVYKYVARDGSVFYTDDPPRGYHYKRIIRTKPRTYAKALKAIKKNKLKYSPLIAEAASKYNIDAKLLHAVILAESAYDSHAVSSAGAVGLMQLMPETARRYGVSDRKDASQNIDGGTRYLRDLLNLFDSNLQLAVAGFNAGEGAVRKYNNSIPPYPETQSYVKQVLSIYGK